jgi:hypothetical protein
MPVDDRSVTQLSEKYEDCLVVIESLLSAESYNTVIIGGDFNTDMHRQTAQTTAFKDFLDRNQLRSTWTIQPDHEQFPQHTFISNNGYKSQIDHFLISLDCCSQVEMCEVLDYSTSSKDVGHLPVRLKFSVRMPNVGPQYTVEKQVPRTIAWHKINSYLDYQHHVEMLLFKDADLLEVDCLSCQDYNCKEPNHLFEIDNLCKHLSDICIEAADKTLPKVKPRKAWPNWNEKIKPLRDDAKFWGSIWKDCGKPNAGIVADLYRQCRRQYHYAIRALKKGEQQSRMNQMAESIAYNKTRDLWTEIKKIRGHSKVSPPNVDGKHSSDDINKIFNDKYMQLYNRLPGDLASVKCRVQSALHNDSQADFTVDACIIDKALQHLKPAKSDGDKGLWSSLIIQAPPSWRRKLAALLSSMLTHGHYADELLVSTIVSLPKDSQGNLCSSDNFRGITLCSSINKLLTGYFC